MLVSRRFSRPLTLACATAALAVAPGTALARPAVDPQPSTPDGRVIVDPKPATQVGGDTTLPLIFSGTALLIAAAGAGLAGRDHQRISHIIE
jgi:hypothetical protein